MTTIKKKLIDNSLFLKTKVIENKQKTGAILCTLLVIIGFFMPFMSASAGVTITGVMNNTVEILNPDNNMIAINLGDFVLQKPIDDIKIYNTRLGDVQLLDQSVLEILRNPIPDKGIINNANQALSSSALDYLVDPKVQEIISTRLERGQEINIILQNIWNVIQNAKSIVEAVNDVSIQARQSMEQVNATMKTIDGYKSTANGFIGFLFIMTIGLMGLICYKRAKIGFSIFLSGILAFFFMLVGIGTAVANTKINEKIVYVVGQINSGIIEMLSSVLTGTFGDIGTFLANFIGQRPNFLGVSFSIQLDIGYWIILFGSLGCFVLLIFAGHKDKKISEEGKEIEALLVETIDCVEKERIEEIIESEEEVEERIATDEV